MSGMDSLFRDKARRDEERIHQIVRDYLTRIDPMLAQGHLNLGNPRNLGVLPAQLGGTGGTNWSNPLTTLGDIVTAGPSGVPQRLALGPSGQLLTATSGGPQWQPLSLPAVAGVAGSYTNLNATIDGTGRVTAASSGATALSNPMSTLGDLITGGPSGTPQRLALGPTGQVLTALSGGPQWQPLPAPSTVAVTAPLTNGGTSTAAQLGIAAATASAAGSMSAADKGKLDGLTATLLTVRLDYSATTDLWNGAALAGGAWNTLIPDQTFAIGDATAICEIVARLGMQIACTVVAPFVTRLNFDNGARLVLLHTSANPGANVYANPAGGGYILPVGALAVGNHTVRVEVYAGAAATAYCRAASVVYEGAALQVLEVRP